MIKKKTIRNIFFVFMIFAGILFVSACKKEIKYNLNYMVDNQTYQTIQVGENKTAVLPDVPSKDGYSFTGWYLDENIWESTFTEEDVVTSDISIYAKFDIETYTITYNNTKDLINDNPNNYTIETTTIILNDLDKTGYTFVGWFNDSNKEVKTIPTGTTGNIVLTAKWESEEFSITYNNTKGATNNNPAGFNIESSTISLTELTAETFVFDGWYDENDELVTSIPSGTSSDVVLTAKWKEYSIVINYDEKLTIKDTDTLDKALFNVSCSDNAEGAYDIDVTVTSSKELVGGETVTITITATANGVTKTVTIENVKVYSTPTGVIKNNGSQYLYTDDNLNLLYTSGVKDSFGETLAVEYQIKDESGTGNTVTIIASATDAAGNSLSSEFSYKLLGTKDGLFTYSGESITGLTNEGKSVLTDIVIPYEMDGVLITTIAGGAFRSNIALTSIVIPNTVKSINQLAFEWCSSLFSVTIGTDLMSIGWNAFSSCYKLVEIYDLSSLDISNENSSTFQGLKSYALSIKTSLDEPSELIYNEEGYVFCHDNSADKYYLVAYIGNETNLVLPSTINEKTYDIFNCAFRENNSIISVIIPEGVTTIGQFAFDYCLNITSVVMPNSVLSISNYAFRDCSSLFTVTLGSGLTSIGLRAFENCYGLVEVYNLSSLNITKENSDSYGKILDCVISIKSSLDEPSGIIYEDNGYVFYLSTENKYYLVAYKGNETNLVLPSTINGNVYDIHSYVFNENQAIKSVVIPTGVTEIGVRAFYNCDSLESVVIPNSVQTIGNKAFQHCISLTNVEIPNVLTLGEEAFRGCSKLSAVTLGSGLTSIEAYTFSDCVSLTSIEIPNSVQRIERRAFYNCFVLESITLGTTISFIGEAVFSDCDALTSIVIPNSVLQISSYAFYGNDSLMSVTLGTNLTSIGTGAFDYCYKLVEVYNLSSLDITKENSNSYGYILDNAISVKTSLDDSSGIILDNGYIFYYDSTLDKYYLVAYTGSETNLVLPSTINGNVYDINSYAFYENNSLTSIVIPTGVTEIKPGAFSSCLKLTSITLPNTVQIVGEYAFNGCCSLLSVTLGTNLTSIGTGAFDDCYKLVEVYNLSSLDITKENSESYGCILDNAISFNTSLDEASILIYDNDGYIFYYDSTLNKYYLLSYIGTETDLILPSTINGSVYDIHSHAFFDNYHLNSIVIPTGVTEIESEAFYLCFGLTSIFIPSSVKKIAGYSFVYCNNLTIYCEIAEKDIPEGWASNWNVSGCPIEWECVIQPKLTEE